MAQQDLNGVQVGARFQQVRSKAVTQHVGIDLLLNPGAAGRMLAGVARGFGIHGLIAGVPAITGKQPDTGFFAQASPVCAEFVEQNGTEHHVAVLATLAALDVNYQPPAIDVADLEARQLCVADAGGVESHEDGAIKGSRSGVDELRYFFLAENRGQAVRLLRVGSVSDAPRPLERLNVEKTQGAEMVGHRTGRQPPFCEEVSLILPNVLRA